jgi:hypothetical protein
MKKLRLVGCERYNFRGELYQKGKVYHVGDNKAQIMLRAEDSFNRPYFAAYVAPEKSREDRIASAAAKAAAAAAREELQADEAIERPDGSEPSDSVPDETVDPEASIEVDTDDDPDLDEDDEENSEEVDVEDRDDGTAVVV